MKPSKCAICGKRFYDFHKLGKQGRAYCTPCAVAACEEYIRNFHGVGDLVFDLEAESSRWTDELRKGERGDDSNIGTAICNAKANAYADAAFRVKRAFGKAPPDAWGFRSDPANSTIKR
jgi:hypothetical protein